jgi:hypothetical protein
LASGGAGANIVLSPPPDPPHLDPAAIVSVLNRHDVRFVVIGAFAALAQGAPIAPTRDVDFTPDETADNLDRLSAALLELGARVRTDSDVEGLPFDHDAASLRRASTWNLICPYGEFDISFRPSGFEGGYAQLIVRAHRMVVEGHELAVADLDDVIRSKEAAGRPKDLRALPALYRFRRSQRAVNRDTPGTG